MSQARTYFSEIRPDYLFFKNINYYISCVKIIYNTKAEDQIWKETKLQKESLP